MRRYIYMWEGEAVEVWHFLFSNTKVLTGWWRYYGKGYERVHSVSSPCMARDFGLYMHIAVKFWSIFMWLDIYISICSSKLFPEFSYVCIIHIELSRLVYKRAMLWYIRESTLSSQYVSQFCFAYIYPSPAYSQGREKAPLHRLTINHQHLVISVGFFFQIVSHNIPQPQHHTIYQHTHNEVYMRESGYI